MRRTLRLLALAALVVTSASCGGDNSDGPDRTNGTTPTTAPPDVLSSTVTTPGPGSEVPANLGDAPLILPPIDQGVLVEQRWLDRDIAQELWPDSESDPDGLTVSLDACRARYPGQWAIDMTLEAPIGVEFPITLGLDVSWGVGDLWTGPPPVEVDLAAPGSFTVTFDAASYLREHIDLLLALDARQREEIPGRLLSGTRGSSGIGFEGARCALEVVYSPNAAVVDPSAYRDGSVVEELVSPEVTAAEGTVEYLAQTADLTDRTTPGRSWALLYGHGLMPVAPVVWMEPNRSFSSLSEHWTLGGRCYTLRLQYHHDDGDPYEVWQYRGCRSDGPADHQPSAVLEVGDWTIVAAGEDQAVVDAAIERLVPFFVTSPLPEPSTALGVTIAETTFGGAVVLLVSVDYGEGGVLIVLESPDIDFSDGPGSGSNGETFRGCWQTTVYQGPGIALVLVGDPMWVVRLGDTALDLKEAEGGIGYAVIEWTSSRPPHPSITTSDGSMPCA